MDRRAFIRRLAVGVFASSMLADALTRRYGTAANIPPERVNTQFTLVDGDLFTPDGSEAQYVVTKSEHSGTIIGDLVGGEMKYWYIPPEPV